MEKVNLYLQETRPNDYGHSGLYRQSTAIPGNHPGNLRGECGIRTHGRPLSLQLFSKQHPYNHLDNSPIPVWEHIDEICRFDSVQFVSMFLECANEKSTAMVMVPCQFFVLIIHKIVFWMQIQDDFIELFG